MTIRILHAILYVPPPLDLWSTLHRLGRHADARGWDADCHTRSWVDLARLLGTGEYDLGVTPSMSALPTDRLPRLVAVDEDQGGFIPGPRRPRWLQ